MVASSSGPEAATSAGREVEVHCAACGERSRFFVGGAGLFASPQALRDRLPPERREEILALASACGPVRAQIGYGLFVCPSCHALSEQLHIYFSSHVPPSCYFKHYCEGCGSQLIARTPAQIPKLPCPRCGQKSLRVERPGTAVQGGSR